MKLSSYLPLYCLIAAVTVVGGHQAQAQQDYRPGEIIVKLKSSRGGAGKAGFLSKASSVHNMTLVHSWQELNMHHFAMKPGADVRQKIQDLSQDPDVEYAEPNYILVKASVGGVQGSVQSLAEARAQYAAQQAQQQSVQAESLSYPMSTADIHVAETWPLLTNDGSTVIVGVVDTGLDLTHPVFVDSDAIWTNPNEIPNNGRDDDQNGYIDDVHGWNFAYGNNNPQDDDSHGTHVSGIILGTNLDFLASPIATSKIKIMPLKFLDSTGSGSVSDAVQAIYYGVNNGARVLNNSWGGRGFSYSLLDAISYAYAHDVVFAAAAGNFSTNNDTTPLYPASYDVPGLISVAATTAVDLLAGFSDFGPSTVPLGSPGDSIYSTFPNGTFGTLSGTSMATPFVSGVAALMIREKPTMTAYQVKSLILSSTKSLVSLAGLVSTSGRLDEKSAVTTAQAATVDASQPVYVAAAGSDGGGDRSPSSTTSGCGLVAKAGHSMASDNDDDDSFAGPSGLQISIFLALLALPLLTYAWIRRALPAESELRSRRRYERFHVDSRVHVRVGDQELVGSVSSISVGGLQLNTDAMLTDGGTVEMSLQSPTGQEIKVEGRIVWSEARKSYGVQFAQVQESMLAALYQWTRQLAADGRY